MQKQDIHKKLRMIRDAEDLGRNDFAIKTGIPKRTIENIENKGTNPRASYLNKVCLAFPKYTLWLMINEVNIDYGQISPQIKNEWERSNLHKINKDNPEPVKFDRFNEEHISYLKECVKNSSFKPLIEEVRNIDKTNYND